MSNSDLAGWFIVCMLAFFSLVAIVGAYVSDKLTERWRRQAQSQAYLIKRRDRV